MGQKVYNEAMNLEKYSKTLSAICSNEKKKKFKKCFDDFFE